MSYALQFYAFALGIRFDISTLAMVWGLFFIFSQIPLRWQKKSFFLVWNGVSYLFLLISVLVFIADFFYYEHGGKRIGHEATAFLNKDLFAILDWFWTQNVIVALSILIAWFSFFGFLWYRLLLLARDFDLARNEPDSEFEKLFHKLPSYFKLFRKLPPFIGLPFRLVLSLLIVVIAIRGGVQSSPLRAGSAILSTNTHLNNLALNPVFTALTDIRSTSLPASEKMEIFQALAIVKEQIQYPGAEFIPSTYPLLRRTIPNTKKTASIKKPNVVLILLESWSGKFISDKEPVQVEGKVVAPHFQNLIKKSVYFSRFFATGGRTTNGLLAMLTGIPDKPGLTAVRTTGAMTNVSALGSLFGKSGYDTFFMTGGDLSFDNLSEILPHWGYKTVLDEKGFEVLGRFKKGAGGFDDESIYQKLHEILVQSETSSPVFATVLTLTTHYPYKVPRKEFEIFSKGKADSDYLNSYHYADFAIADFLSKAQNSKYFSDTIFVFVGDHTHHRDLNYYEDRNIPFLVYAPKFFPPEVRTDIASQLDVLPTLLSFLPDPIEFSAMGKDILHNKSKSAYFAYGSGYGWIEDNVFLFRSVDGKLEFPLTVDLPLEKNKICENMAKLCTQYSIKAKSYLNLSTELLNRNLIFP